jgi:hypothetical protein
MIVLYGCGVGTTRFARRRYTPWLAVFACWACVRRHARNRTQCYRAQDHQSTRTYVRQGNLAPAEGSRAGAVTTVNQQR